MTDRLKLAWTQSAPDHLVVQAQAFVEEWLLRLLPTRDAPPARLHGAMHDAVFPGGRRARPLLCRLVADSYGGGDDEMVGRLAAAIELVHCASLVQDDLPCFDDAATRRGQPACHVVYGEATAILVGDALLTLAFETLANAPVRRAPVAFRLMGLLTAAAGSSHGVIGGQALELEPHPVELEIYHRHKTAALFRAAAAGGAICCGAESDVSRWSRIGELIGCALQLRDDMEDVGGNAADLGKPAGRDAALGRPNAALQVGMDGCQHKRAEVIDAVRELLGPPTTETEALHRLVEEVTRPAVRQAG
ncbi:MAG: geranylgeranyl pyrophosphate synthase [Myxococcales bacterium]|nr:geranylgeranyl pyrophosphate synthase [Myxococcales bacterium]